MITKLNDTEPGLRLVISLFIGSIIRCGNKYRARKLFFLAMDLLRFRLRRRGLRFGYMYQAFLPYRILLKAVRNAAPKVALYSKRVGGVIYRLPRLVYHNSVSYSTAIRWIVQGARNRKGKSFQSRLASEIYDTYLGRSSATKRKMEIYRVAVLNRPFMKYMRPKPRGRR